MLVGGHEVQQMGTPFQGHAAVQIILQPGTRQSEGATTGTAGKHAKDIHKAAPIEGDFKLSD